jgi:hypothetical protein
VKMYFNQFTKSLIHNTKKNFQTMFDEKNLLALAAILSLFECVGTLLCFHNV